MEIIPEPAKKHCRGAYFAFFEYRLSYSRRVNGHAELPAVQAAASANQRPPHRRPFITQHAEDARDCSSRLQLPPSSMVQATSTDDSRCEHDPYSPHVSVPNDVPTVSRLAATATSSRAGVLAPSNLLGSDGLSTKRHFTSRGRASSTVGRRRFIDKRQ